MESEEAAVSNILDSRHSLLQSSLTPDLGAPQVLPTIEEHVIPSAPPFEPRRQNSLFASDDDLARKRLLAPIDVDAANFLDAHDEATPGSASCSQIPYFGIEYSQLGSQSASQHLAYGAAHAQNVSPAFINRNEWPVDPAEFTAPLLQTSPHGDNTSPLANLPSSSLPSVMVWDSRQPMSSHVNTPQPATIYHYDPQWAGGRPDEEPLHHPPPYVPQKIYASCGQYPSQLPEYIPFGMGVLLDDVLNGRFHDLPDPKTQVLLKVPSNVSLRICVSRPTNLPFLVLTS
jgi:hypothetical protein